MTDFTANTLSSHPFVSGFYYVAGFIFGLVATLLVPGALAGILLRPAPVPFARVMEALVFVLVIASAICSFAFAAEFWIAFHGANRYEWYTFWHARTGSRWTWCLYLSYLTVFLPQLFWWPRWRKSLLASLLVALAASSARWLEHLVIIMTQ